MTQEVDDHSDPCMLQGSPTTTVGDLHWWNLRCSQMRTLR